MSLIAVQFSHIYLPWPIIGHCISRWGRRCISISGINGRRVAVWPIAVYRLPGWCTYGISNTVWCVVICFLIDETVVYPYFKIVAYFRIYIWSYRISLKIIIDINTIVLVMTHGNKVIGIIISSWDRKVIILCPGILRIHRWCPVLSRQVSKVIRTRWI